MDPKVKKYMPFGIVGGLIFIGLAIYIINTALWMPTVNLSESYVPAGFLLGLWHGATVVLAFITSWFNNTITIYQAGNSGFLYNLGYVIGLTIALGGGARASRSRKNCK